MKPLINIPRTLTFQVIHRLKSTLNLKGLPQFFSSFFIHLQLLHCPLIFLIFLHVLPLFLPIPTSAQYLQINKKDGTNQKIPTSFIDSVTFDSQYINVYKKDNTLEKIFKSVVDSLTHLMDTSSSGTVTDIDGNIYNTVTIGTQVWFKENLKVTKYRNGDAIPTTTSTIPNDSTSKYQWAYDGADSNVATYGRLYTWYAVTDSRYVCPAGWHVPSDAEWATLTGYLGGESVAGGKMKEAGTDHWNSPNTGADNSSGFTALPGGYRNNDGTFNYIGNYGNWWSAAEYDATYAWYRYLDFGNADATRYYDFKHYGFSVRCVRD